MHTAAATTTLAIFIKPFYAPSAAYLLKDKRDVLTAAVTGIALVGASLLIFGLETHAAYLEVLQEGKGWGWTGSLPRRYTPFWILDEFAIVMKAALVIFVLGISLRYRHVKGHRYRALLCLGIVTAVLAGPTANTLTLAAGIPAYIIAFVDEYRRGGSLVVIPVAAVVATHLSKFLLVSVATLGPQYITGIPWAVIYQTVFAIQPATLSLLLLWGLLLGRVTNASWLPQLDETRDKIRTRFRI